MKRFVLCAALVPAALLIPATQVFAAACCGGAAAVPALITGDARAQMSLSAAYDSLIGHAQAEGPALFDPSAERESSQRLRLEGALLVGEDWQIGASLPLVRKARPAGGREAAWAGLGDLALTVGYEALPESGYSLYRPHGYAFAQITLPTAPSIYDASQALALDALGHGFYTLSAGMIFLKVWGSVDANLLVEAHHSFDRVFAQSGAVHPGNGASLGLNAGYNRGALRFGLGLRPQWESAVVASGVAASPKSVFDTSLSLAYSDSPEWSLSLVYSDQTLLGPARNSALSRTIALKGQYRWLR